MAKRKHRKKSQGGSKILAYIAWILAVIALVLSSLVIGYYFGYDDAKVEIQKEQKTLKVHKRTHLKKENKSKIVEEKSVSKRLKEVLKQKRVKYISAAHELDDGTLANPPKMITRKVVFFSSRPKLAIIIDDVGTASQVKAIKSLQLPLTMSFLPPSKARPNTPKLAAQENFYMVHLPLEAQNWSAEEPHTLRINDSQQVISQRIKKIKQLFPKVEYVNNHTGSKFTANEVAMNRLIYALNANKIHFIDSRTTAKTQAPKVLKNFGIKYIARDVFLDHHLDKPYVLEQIKHAIAVAKSHGSAIAIGHPHKNTLQALYESKKLLKDVDLVYINRL